MKDRVIRLGALVAGLGTILMAAGGAALRVAGPASDQSFNISSPVVFVLAAAAAATYAVVGVLIARRLPRHAVPWIFLSSGFAFAGVIFTWAYAIVASSVQPPLDGIALSALVNTAVLTPTGLALGILLLHVFPDGRPVDRLSRRATLLLPVAAAVTGVGIVLTPGSVGIFTGVANPLAPDIPHIGRLLGIVGALGSVVLALIGFRSLWVRYRGAAAVTREQIRWFVWAGGLSGAVTCAMVAIWTLYPDVLNTPYETVLLLFLAGAVTLIPIACAIAILRHRLYDIDRLISKTFVYGTLLALIAGAYSAGIKGLDRLFVAVTGQSSDLVAVLTTLVLAISFDPLRRRLTEFAKRFDEPPTPAARAAARLDDALVDAVAARVIERLGASPTALSEPVRHERGTRSPLAARRRKGRLQPVSTVPPPDAGAPAHQTGGS